MLNRNVAYVRRRQRRIVERFARELVALFEQASRERHRQVCAIIGHDPYDGDVCLYCRQVLS